MRAVVRASRACAAFVWLALVSATATAQAAPGTASPAPPTEVGERTPPREAGEANASEEPERSTRVPEEPGDGESIVPSTPDADGASGSEPPDGSVVPATGDTGGPFHDPPGGTEESASTTTDATERAAPSTSDAETASTTESSAPSTEGSEQTWPGEPRAPVYATWWFWTAIASAVLGITLAVVIGLTTQDPVSAGRRAGLVIHF